MPEYPKRSQFFADFYAEGTLPSQALNPMLMGKPSELGTVSIAIETSRFNNGNEAFTNTAPETGLFVIQGLKHVTEKLITPGEHHAKLSINDNVHAYGKFIHTNPTGYTAEDLAYGMVHDELRNGVEYKSAMLTVPNFDFQEPILPVTIQKINAIPRQY